MLLGFFNNFPTVQDSQLIKTTCEQRSHLKVRKILPLIMWPLKVGKILPFNMPPKQRVSLTFKKITDPKLWQVECLEGMAYPTHIFD